jgi:hypothetical protein
VASLETGLEAHGRRLARLVIADLHQRAIFGHRGRRERPELTATRRGGVAEQEIAQAPAGELVEVRAKRVLERALPALRPDAGRRRAPIAVGAPRVRETREGP